MKRFLIFIGIIVAAGFLLHAFYSFRRYNVILITIDTLRPDYLSCYNPHAKPTPNIDRIAQNGVLFTNAFSLIPITMPSHTSILTSREPYKLNLFNNGDRFDHRVPMITDILEPKGYTSSAFISLGVLSGAFGLASGFDRYEDSFENTNGRFYKVASEVNAVAVPWIEKNRKKRFFAWIHYSDPHEPYITVDAPPDTEVLVNDQPYKKFCIAKKEKIAIDFLAQPGENKVELRAISPSGIPRVSAAGSSRFLDPKISVSPSQSAEVAYGNNWTNLKLRNGTEVRYFDKEATLKVINKARQPQPVQVRFSGGVWEKRANIIRQNYAAEVRYADHYIGLLWDKLDQLDLLDHTIIVVTADHGEGLKTHGILGHVDKLWNETTHIPFMIYYPHMGYRGKKEHQLVNLLDIMPTILDLLHIGNNKPMEGQSLKHYVSWSPVDWIFSKRLNRSWTFSSTFSPEAALNSFAITNGMIKVIHTPAKRAIQWEAYDLSTDSVEKKNLARFEPRRFEALSIPRNLLEAHQHEAEAAHEKRKNPSLSEEEQQMLRGLGYVGSGDDYGPQEDNPQ